MSLKTTTMMMASLLALSLAPLSEAAVDRTPPTRPTNLRVLGVTSYSVSLAWSPSTDNSGRFSYVVCCAYTSQQSFPQVATSATYTTGLEAGRSFSLRIYAVDAAGNYSGASNSVTVRLPSDRQPPTKPVVSVTDVGPTHVSLAWASSDDGPHVWYRVLRDGTPIIQGSASTTAIVPLLEPETDYTFTVQAMDFGRNSSPPSDPAAASTKPSNPNDVTPPTTPTNLRESSYGCEVELRWNESSDDLDPQWVIRYEISVNGVVDHNLALRQTRTIVYGTASGPNTFSVVAVDTAGNRSETASLTVNLDCSF